MRICIICEGSYPYVPGGVSNWVRMLIEKFSDIEFSIIAITTTEEEMPVYKCAVPDNVKEIRTVYIGDVRFNPAEKRVRPSKEEYTSLTALVRGGMDEKAWAGIRKLAKRHSGHISGLLMSRAFFDVCRDEYVRMNSSQVFSQYLWNMRGMCFPVLYLLSVDYLQADLYHSVSAGYAGIVGACLSMETGTPFLLSEHGIYTREREEDIIRSSWVEACFKDRWISFFQDLSKAAYGQADAVTTLFEQNRKAQLELGCPEEKLHIIPNGTCVDNAPGTDKPEKPLTLGAVVRVVPIKDIKTMLLAFDEVRQSFPDATLKIMGSIEEDPLYYRECLEFLEDLEISGVEFTGHVNVKEYLKNIDILLLSSISEGQPLAVLEGMAAGIPFVTTDVGDCRDLIEGGSDIGPAGFVVPVMDSRAFADAVKKLAVDQALRKAMGRNGRERVKERYNIEDMFRSFRDLYNKLGGE